MNHYDTNLDKNKANYVPLTPLSFLQRAKDIYPNYEAIVYEDRKYTWIEVYIRAIKFASALEKIGIKKGDTVSFLAFNTPEIFEAHYSVPMTGAVLNTINIRLDANTIAYILNHSDAKVLVVDRQLHTEVKKAHALHSTEHQLFPCCFKQNARAWCAALNKLHFISALSDEKTQKKLLTN